MAAMTSERRVREETWAYQTFKLPDGKTAYRGAIAAFDPLTGKCLPAEERPDLFPLGLFYETVVNASGADKDVTVQLFEERRLWRFANDLEAPVLPVDVGKDVYMVDDQTVSISAGEGRSVLGRAWHVDATLGVAVEAR